MHLTFNSLLKIASLVLLVICLTMLPAFLVSLYYNEYDVAYVFFLIILLGLIIGLLLRTKFKKPIDYLRVSDGFIIVAMSWFLAAIISAIPFWATGSIPSPIDAFFESCSGLSTTGSTILNDIEALPKGILFWRSFTHWIGGMGILVFAIALMPSLGISGQNIVVSETPGPMLDKISSKMSTTARTLYVIYLTCTLLETLFLKAAGMSLFDAMIHTFGTVGTGGFSCYNDSIAHFDSNLIRIIITVFMLICGTNFNLFFMYLKNGIQVFIHDAEFKLYIFIIGFFSLFTFCMLLITDGTEHLIDTAVNSIFQITSIVTTTGYSTVDYMLWPAICQMIILCMMFVGGCSSSTGGGIKVIRILILSKLIGHGFQVRLHHNNIEEVKLNGNRLSRDTIIGVTNFTFLYVFMVFIGSFILSFDNIDLLTTVSSVITCLCNIGPGFNQVGPADTFANFSIFSKFTLSVCMITGRLELYTIFILMMPSFWRRDY